MQKESKTNPSTKQCSLGSYELGAMNSVLLGKVNTAAPKRIMNNESTDSQNADYEVKM